MIKEGSSMVVKLSDLQLRNGCRSFNAHGLYLANNERAV